MEQKDGRPVQGPPAPPPAAPTLADVLSALMDIKREGIETRQAVGALAERQDALAERLETVAATMPVPEAPPEPEPQPDEPVTVRSRIPVPFIVMWNGVREVIPPLGARVMPRWKAHHARKHSVFALDITSEQCEYKIGIDGEHDTSPLSQDLLDKYRNELLAFPPDWAHRSYMERQAPAEETHDRPPGTVMRGDGGNRAGIASLLAISAG